MAPRDTPDLPDADAARDDWDERIGRSSGPVDTSQPRLRPPRRPRVAAGRHQITVNWDPVAGACGYLVYRADSADGPFDPVDHWGQDVLAVPHPPYCDTTGVAGREYWYAVAALSDVTTVGSLSDAVPVASLSDWQQDAPAEVSLVVDAENPIGPLPRPWRPMIGSEHLSHLLSTDVTGGRPIGMELASALRVVREEIGALAVRAHGILCDDLGVYREVDGKPVHDFSGVDRVYDRVLGLGMRPVVELSFMPRELASDPSKTVFAYGAGISPPKDWTRWYNLVRDLTAHLVGRYGLDEVRDHWMFEVWNEANLDVFWSGTPEEFWKLYDLSAGAVKDVHPDLCVGGPSSAAAGWVTGLLEHLDGTDVPLDFVSTHTYGSPPLDVRPQLERYGRAGTPVCWTEWGVTPRHFNPVSDSVFSAAFLARGMRSAAGRIEALSYWVASDHFEELGRPPALLHGGFGLITVGGLCKPRFWALALLEQLGEDELPVRASGDGADSLVEAWAARDTGGRVTLAVWNATLDQSKADGYPPLDREITVRVNELPHPVYDLRHLRVDSHHSNIAAVWDRIRAGADWPDEAQWQTLHAANRLEELHSTIRVEPENDSLHLTFKLPMPGMSFIELVPS